MNKCYFGVITFWCWLASSRSGWGLDSFYHLHSCDTNTLSSLIVSSSSMGFSTSLSISELGPTTFNVNVGVCYLSFRKCVPRGFKSSPKNKHLFLLFLFKNLKNFLHHKLQSFKVSTRFNKHDLIHEHLLFFCRLSIYIIWYGLTCAIFFSFLACSFSLWIFLNS
jgi:hypothetical protein